MSIRSLVMALALAFAGSAFASQCPTLMAEFDELVAGAEVDEATLAEATKLREEGEALHKAGQHDESVEKLEAALDLLDTD